MSFVSNHLIQIQMAKIWCGVFMQGRVRRWLLELWRQKVGCDLYPLR